MGRGSKAAELGGDVAEEIDPTGLQKQTTKAAKENQPLTQLPARKWEDLWKELGILTILLGKTETAYASCCYSCCDHAFFIVLLANAKACAMQHKKNI